MRYLDRIASTDSPDDRAKLRGQLWGALSVGTYGSLSIRELRMSLERLSGDTLLLLDEARRSKHRDYETLSRWVMRYAPDSAIQPDESVLRELLVYSAAFDSITSGDCVHLFVTSLREYEKLPKMNDYSQADEGTNALIRGLLSISEYLYSDWFEDDCDSVPKSIHIPELVDVIFDYPDKVEGIRNLIVNRDSTDAEMIRAVITGNASPSLYEGAL